MVKKKMYQRIQKLKKQGYSKTEISTELKIDPATVRKYYNMNPDTYQRYLGDVQERKKSFDAYAEEIQQIYDLNDSKRLNMAAVYDYLEEKYGELPGNEQTLRNHIRYLIRIGRLDLTNRIRLYEKVDTLPYGKQLQIDFGVHKSDQGLKLYIFAAVLSASRYKYIAFQDQPFTTMHVIAHLLDCFDYLGGIPEELVIDQDSIMVASENYGNIMFTEKFSLFIEEMRLRMYVCRKSDPESKGKIENVIKYVKYNFLQVRSFATLEEAQESLSKWLKRRGNGKISQATKLVPLHEIEEERKHLRPLKNSLFRKESLLGREIRLVSDKSYIMVDTNEYSVPVAYRNRTVEIYKTDRELHVYDEKTRSEIASHCISPLSGQRIHNRDHFRSKTLDIDALHQQIRELHSFETWIKFVELNLAKFKRYSRDQCMLAKTHFQEIEDEHILEMAVEYCLENNTVSMTELRDTYQHMLKEHHQEQDAIHQALLRAFSQVKPAAPQVSTRRVADYEKLVGSGSGGKK
jgi:transposase